MEKKNKYKFISNILILLVFIWGFYFSFLLINVKSKSENLNYIPSNAFFVGKLDANELIKSSFKQVVLQDRNEAIIRIINETLTSSTDKKSKKNGINPFSDIIIFASNYKEGKLIGLSFNLLNESDFRKVVPEYLSSNQFVSVKDNVGFIYFYEPTDPTYSIPLKELKGYVNNQLRFKKFEDFLATKQTSDNIITFLTKTHSITEDVIIKSSINSLQLNENSIDFQSSIELKDKISAFGTVLKPAKKALYFSSFIFPKMINDSLIGYLKGKQIVLPEINNFSFNYSGSEFGEFNNEMVIIPSIDVVIQFKSTFSIENFIDENLSKIDNRIVFKNNQVIIGDYTYFTKQIDEKTIYIGKNKNPQISPKMNQSLFQFSGSLENLFHFKGGGFVLSLLEINPIYNSSKSFISNTDYIDIRLQNISANKLKLDGTLKFKNKHFPSSEIGLLILKSGLIN